MNNITELHHLEGLHCVLASLRRFQEMQLWGVEVNSQEDGTVQC